MLMNGIQTVLNVVPPKTTLPILSNVLLEADANGFRIGATDLDQSIVTGVPAQIAETGAITVPARKFAEIVRELPDTPVEIEVDGVKIVIRCDRGVFRLIGVDRDEFPNFPEVQSDVSVTVSPAVLQRLIRKTIFAVSTDETRPGLGGAYCRMESAKIMMVATDGHRLAKVTVPSEIDTAITEGIIIPPKALHNLARLIGETELPPRITIGKNHTVFQLEHTTLYSRLIEATFPDYERVIPKNNSKILSVNRDMLHSAVRRVAVLSNATTRQIRFSIRPGYIELSASSHDIGGEAREEVPAQYDGVPLDTAYDYRFILDVVDRMDSDEIVFRLETPVSAGLITPSETPEGEEYLCLVMPLRFTD
jgi:DNA polymerase-3 subunit beta